jgi:glucose-1-phosphate thymidylyltransferase
MVDMLDANRLVLQDIQHRVDGDVRGESVIQGKVIIEPGAVIIDSTLRGPLIIGRGATVEHAYIGPFSAIGDGCYIRASEIEHTIVMERSRILDMSARIEDSLIGKDVVLSRAPRKPRAHKMMLGDHSVVGLA